VRLCIIIRPVGIVRDHVAIVECERGERLPTRITPEIEKVVGYPCKKIRASSDEDGHNHFSVALK